MSTTPFADLIAQADAAKPVVAPAGEYAVVCQKASDTKTSTNKDMLKLSVKVAVGPHKGHEVSGNQTLSPENPKAVRIFMKFLDSFGLDEDFLKALPPREDGGPDFKAVAAALQGRYAMLSLTEGEWNDEARNEFGYFRKPTAEEQAAIEGAVDALGADGAFAAPSASADPFVASAPPAGGETANF